MIFNKRNKSLKKQNTRQSWMKNTNGFFSRVRFVFSDDSPFAKRALRQSAITALIIPTLILGMILAIVQGFSYHDYKVSHTMRNNSEMSLRFRAGDGTAYSGQPQNTLTYGRTMKSKDGKRLVTYIKTNLTDSSTNGFNMPVIGEAYMLNLVSSDPKIKDVTAKMTWFHLNTIYVELSTKTTFPDSAFAVMIEPKTYSSFDGSGTTLITSDDRDFTQQANSSSVSYSTKKDETPVDPYWAYRINANDEHVADILTGDKFDFKKIVEQTSFNDRQKSLIKQRNTAKTAYADAKKKQNIAQIAYDNVKKSDNQDNASANLNTAKANTKTAKDSYKDAKQAVLNNQKKLSEVDEPKDWSTKVKHQNMSAAGVVN